MATHVHAANAAGPVAVRKHSRVSVPAFALAVSGILLLSGCMGAERGLVAGPDPSDPAIPVAAVGYRSTTASYVSQRPVAPAPWRLQNERAAPQPKSDQ